jgi:2-polyprenyl-3-methyl-5-hydroxy-6-metoxy-1,4-benzoquinol methylase
MTERDKQRYASPPVDTPYPKEYFFHLLAPCAGKKILEIACGDGHDACLAAYYGAEVYAYDISEAAVDLTRKCAEANGVSERVHVMRCSDIDEAFAGEQFDSIAGFAALHHLPQEDLASKICSRLRPDGVAVFSEPVVNSRVLEAVRRLIPYRIEITPDEEHLNDRAIAELAKPFRRISRRDFECVARIYPLLRRYPKLVRALFKIDHSLMKIRPMRRFASVSVFALYRS